MSLAITQQSSTKSPQGSDSVNVPRFNAFDVTVIHGGQPLLTNGSGVITFREGATEITLYGLDGKVPETGAQVSIWGVSQQYGHFYLPNAKCTAHGADILEGSATFVQLLAPPLTGVGIPPGNANASVASEYGLLVVSEAEAVLKSNVGATEITVYGFAADTLPRVGAVMKIWGASKAEGPFFLPNAKCISHGQGILKNSATFLQIIAPRLEEDGLPRFNAFDIHVTRHAQSMLQNGKGTTTFLFGGTELTVYGFERDKSPEVGSVVSIWGVSLERGYFFLPNAKCTSRGVGELEGSATFSQMSIGPTGK